MKTGNFSRYLLIIFSQLLCLGASGQNERKDVDLLVNKYKDKDSVVVRNAFGTARLGVAIKRNAKGQPASIILSGYAENEQTAENILAPLTKAKEKQGYITNSKFATVFSTETVLVHVYNKGSQYAKYGSGRVQVPSYISSESMTQQQRTEYLQRVQDRLLGVTFIYMEVGDITRQGKGDTEKFTF